MKSKFTYYPSHSQSAVFIIDMDDGMSVTNDAEAVVTEVLVNHPGKRIIYRDTMGSWSELKHDGSKFTGFSPLSIYENGEIYNVTQAMIDVLPADKPKATGLRR